MGKKYEHSIWKYSIRSRSLVYIGPNVSAIERLYLLRSWPVLMEDKTTSSQFRNGDVSTSTAALMSGQWKKMNTTRGRREKWTAISHCLYLKPRC